MSKKVLRFLSPFLFFMFLCFDITVAQPPPPGGTGPPCWPPPCIPIDGGISFLIAAGVAYGAKKTLDYQKNNSNEELD